MGRARWFVTTLTIAIESGVLTNGRFFMAGRSRGLPTAGQSFPAGRQAVPVRCGGPHQPVQSTGGRHGQLRGSVGSSVGPLSVQRRRRPAGTGTRPGRPVSCDAAEPVFRVINPLAAPSLELMAIWRRRRSRQRSQCSGRVFPQRAIGTCRPPRSAAYVTYYEVHMIGDTYSSVTGRNVNFHSDP